MLSFFRKELNAIKKDYGKIMDRQQKWDIRFLQLSKFIASWSKDPSTKCGAVIVRDINRVVSIGYNGYPKGVADDDTLMIREKKYPRILHAEPNAIVMARQDLSGCTIYVFPLLPCGQCAALIIQSGISRVVSVIPSDRERKNRWLDSNNVAIEMFQMASVEVKTYNEGDCDV